MKWEYNIISFDLDSWKITGKRRRWLNDLGRTGWEAVNFNYVPNGGRYVLLKLKRPLLGKRSASKPENPGPIPTPGPGDNHPFLNSRNAWEKGSLPPKCP